MSQYIYIYIISFVENVPPVALYDDRIVEIQGEPAAMHKALELIASYLRKFLVDRTVIPLFEAQVCTLFYFYFLCHCFILF